jgi:1,4-dihydroxy-2-naphthoate octaprenyltransferase
MAKSPLAVQQRSLPVAVLARTLLVHLRLHFQLLLAPIFLWGYLLSDHPLTTRFWFAFCAFHLFLYGGTTAFNSYYDQDEGPVGGLEKPPPALPALLPFSLAMQAIGAGLAALVNWPFFLIYLTIFAMGAAYSHPSIRWKGRPLGGLLTVAIGQGLLAGLGGWASAYPQWVTPPALAWLGIVAVALITTGFYPITQIYQVEEDLARGDLTFAAWAGVRGTFTFTIVTLGLAALVLIWVMAQVVGGGQALLVALFYLGLLVTIIRWAQRYDARQVIANFRYVMRIYTLTSTGFLLFLALQLLLSV